MRIFFAFVIFLAVPHTAGAQPACPSGSTPILTCTFSQGAKTLVSCRDGAVATYAFGRAGKAPELAISMPIEALSYVPWPGVGSAIWDEVGFANEGVSYVLWQNFNRHPDEAPTLTAGISVQRGTTELARLECDEGTITPAIDQLWDVFTALNQCYNRSDSTWAPCS